MKTNFPDVPTEISVLPNSNGRRSGVDTAPLSSPYCKTGFNVLKT